MCTNWILQRDGSLRPCHVCKQCKLIRYFDWVGRCIAESKVSAHTFVVCLTYGHDPHLTSVEDHTHAHLLLYSDVQKYLKLLRKHTKGRIRFFCAGEYGSKKGRAHWHLVIFCKKNPPPNIRFDERYIHQWKAGAALWPHGWSFWQPAVTENIRYVVGYLHKMKQNDEYRMFRYSKMPHIGAEYFAQLARQSVEQGLPPNNRYRFPNDWTKNRNLREYRLSRAALYHYLREYDEEWVRRHGSRNWPQSDLLDLYVDVRGRIDRRLAHERDYSEEFEERSLYLRGRERTPVWHTMTSGDGTAVMLHPLQLRSDAYRKQSRGE